MQSKDQASDRDPRNVTGGRVPLQKFVFGSLALFHVEMPDVSHVVDAQCAVLSCSVFAAQRFAPAVAFLSVPLSLSSWPCITLPITKTLISVFVHSFISFLREFYESTKLRAHTAVCPQSLYIAVHAGKIMILTRTSSRTIYVYIHIIILARPAACFTACSSGIRASRSLFKPFRKHVRSHYIVLYALHSLCIFTPLHFPANSKTIFLT